MPPPTKISEKDPAGTLTGEELLVLVQGGATRQTTLGKAVTLEVATLAELEALDTTAFDTGAVVYVASLDDTFTLYQLGGLTVQTAVVVAAGVGVARWKRTGTPSQRWLQQTTWYIDSTGGDDEGSGLVAEPLATFAEFVRRVGYIYRPSQAVTLTLMNDLPSTDPIELRHIAFTDPVGLVLNPLHIFGTFAMTDSGEVTVSSSNNAAANTQGVVTIDNPVLTGELLALMRNASTGAFAPVINGPATDTSYQSQWYAAAAGPFGGGQTAANPLVGVQVEVGAPTYAFVGELESTMLGGLSLFRLGMTAFGTIKNAYLVSCTGFGGTLDTCTLQGSAVGAAFLESSGVTGGLCAQQCTSLRGGLNLGGSCRIGGASGGAGLILKGGTSFVTSNAILAGSLSFAMELENATLILEVANSIYGGNSPMKLRAGATLRRRVTTGVNTSKTGTAVTWDTADSPFRITGATPTFTQLTTNTWDATTGYNAAANTNVLHLQSGARIITSS